MTEPRTCPKCGKDLPEGLPESLCPNCLWEQAKGGQEDEATVESGDKEKDEATAQPATITMTGDKVRYLGDYELVEEVARGGMGVVYRAKQISLNRDVALKMILAGDFADDEQIARFHTEAEAAANLQHPNIVAIHEIGEHEGRHYFSMDYVEGQNLSQRLKDKPLSVTESAEYLKTIAEAIHYAHKQGVLHRDLKPSNVILDEHGQPQITDFGLAKQINNDDGLTQSEAAMGTPSYMAPEQALDTKRVTATADVYSLGAILYECLTNQPPFKGKTAMSTIHQAMVEQPESPSKLNPQVNQDLETICLKCLEKDPRQRYQTAGELAEELGRFLNHEPIVARPPSFARKSLHWFSRHPWVVTVSCAVLTVAVLFLAIGLWENSRYKQWQLLISNAVSASHDLRPGVTNRTEIYEAGMRDLQEAAEIQPHVMVVNVAMDLIAGGMEGIQRIPMGHAPVDGTNLLSYAFDKDQRILAAGYADGSVDAVDLKSGERLLSLKGEVVTMNPVALSDDGKFLAYVNRSEDSRGVAILNIESGQSVTNLRGQDGEISAIAFSRDGRRMATAARGRWLETNCMEIKLWNWRTGIANYSVLFPEIDPSRQKDANVWRRIGRPKPELVPYDGVIHELEFGPSGRYLAALSDARGYDNKMLDLSGMEEPLTSVESVDTAFEFAKAAELRLSRNWRFVSGIALTRNSRGLAGLRRELDPTTLAMVSDAGLYLLNRTLPRRKGRDWGATRPELECPVHLVRSDGDGMAFFSNGDEHSWVWGESGSAPDSPIPGRVLNAGFDGRTVALDERRDQYLVYDPAGVIAAMERHGLSFTFPPKHQMERIRTKLYSRYVTRDHAIQVLGALVFLFITCLPRAWNKRCRRKGVSVRWSLRALEVLAVLSCFLIVVILTFYGTLAFLWRDSLSYYDGWVYSRVCLSLAGVAAGVSWFGITSLFQKEISADRLETVSPTRVESLSFWLGSTVLFTLMLGVGFGFSLSELIEQFYQLDGLTFVLVVLIGVLVGIGASNHTYLKELSADARGKVRTVVEMLGVMIVVVFLGMIPFVKIVVVTGATCGLLASILITPFLYPVLGLSIWDLIRRCWRK